jgi:hypothetical protein
MRVNALIEIDDAMHTLFEIENGMLALDTLF